jgi:hypothetical protein
MLEPTTSATHAVLSSPELLTVIFEFYDTSLRDGRYFAMIGSLWFAVYIRTHWHAIHDPRLLIAATNDFDLQVSHDDFQIHLTLRLIPPPALY